VITLIIELCFVAVFVEALVAYFRRRDGLQRDVVLVFVAMAVVFVLDLWQKIAGQPPAVVRGLSAVLLLAQPYLTLRLVTRLRPVPRWLRWSALLGVAGTAAPFALGRPLPTPMVLAAVGVFVAVEAIAAGFLASEARQRSGSPRVRLALAAAATAAFAVAILAAGAGTAGGNTVTNTIARGLALASGVAYLLAFAPPRWLRRSWSASAGYAVTRRLLRAPPGESMAATWQRYAATVREVAGADAAVVLLEREGRVREVTFMPTRAGAGQHGGGLDYPSEALDAMLAAPQPVALGRGGGPDLATALAARVGACFVSAVPLGLPGGLRGALVLLNTHRRLFSDDDLHLLGELGAHAGLLAERGALLAEQARLNADLGAAVDSLSLASKAKSDFLASMSHELRTPLNAIIGFSDLMDGEETEAGEGMRLVPAEWIGHIRTSGRHLLDLINDILDLAKVEAGRIDLKLEPIALPTTIAEVVTALRPLTDRKHLRVTTDVPALAVTADRIRLRQILDNLLSNSIKFTPDGGRIHISAAGSTTEVRVSVADTGIGIAPADQKAVFEEFTQVGDAAARKAGTGLGLALTRRLVEAHSGTVELESELGVGTTFTVCLPRTATPVSGEQFPATGPNGPGGVLVVEDDVAAAQLLCARLRDVGYEPILARGGAQCLDLAHKAHPDAILLDILLPDIDGWQVLRSLKADPATRDIPVIIATVLDEHDVGLALGAVDYLVKPIEPDALVALLTRHALLPTPPAAISVLAIDDEPAALDLVSETLKRHNVATTTAATGAQGLELARANHYDLIICDLLLPDLDGFHLVAALHADPATAGVPVLILTACDLSAADAGRLRGAVLDVVHKGESASGQLREWLTRLSSR
jgi:signal transduction histidine kinase/CheY-like chemotaxis protein